MNKNSSIFLGMLTAALFAGAPLAMAADSPQDNDAVRNVQPAAKDMNKMRNDMDNIKKDMSRNTQTPGAMTDMDLAERVKRSLDSYSGLDVRANNGVVDISGTVRTGSEKSDILKRARNVQGVRSVNENITVSQNSSGGIGSYIDDASITTVVKGKLLGQSGLDSMDISVETTNGIVTLTGEVENNAQVGLALGVAKEADGVKEVVNHLTYKE